MNTAHLQSGAKTKTVVSVRRLYGLSVPYAYSIILFGALFCNLSAKFFHAYKNNLVHEYLNWVPAEIAVLLAIEVVLSIICFRRPHRPVIRTAVIFAAVVCTWSVMNAGWLIRTGTQILPSVLLPLFRSPLNALSIIGVNLIKMPVVAVILLGPSAVALTFFFFVLAKPVPATYSRKFFINKIILSLAVITIAILAHIMLDKPGSKPIASAGLRHNCQLRAVTCFLSADSDKPYKVDLANISRTIPAFDQIQIARGDGRTGNINHNIVIVVLEGIQYKYTSLENPQSNLTPYLADLADDGVEFANTRSSVTHTTKALFALLTGRYPSTHQDLAEAVPAAKPYASLATILKSKLNFRAAFFQSAKGNFECRPGLVYNLGFDKFWAREDLNDPNAFLGYLACDEFSMLKPISEWIKSDNNPFLIVIMCSVTHDPYEVPEWFAATTKEPLERYLQSIRYTDKFIAALDAELGRCNLSDNTVFCVIGDHGEAFGEHGLHGHERIAFEENLHIPWLMKSPLLIEPATKITVPLSSVDLTPTLLSLFGFDVTSAEFDGINALGKVTDGRKVYFSSWMRHGPAGCVQGNLKYIYNPLEKITFVYDLSSDPSEFKPIQPSGENAREIVDNILAWRKNSIFKINQQPTGKKTLFGAWSCRWNNRVSSAKYIYEEKRQDALISLPD